MAIFKRLESMGHEQVLFCQDSSTGLKAIIAIHDTTLGPALGGCRMWDYASDEDALEDVLRLSRGMTYKAAVSGLNLGGGKAVIVGDPKKLKSESFFRSFGRFVNSLNGRYITAEDVNIRVSDMEYVALETRYVTGTSSHKGGSGDPSPVTAWGVFHGIKASVKHQLGADSLKGIQVAVQGCGSVGSHLVEYLHSEGAKVYVSDISKERIQALVERFGIEAVDNDKVMQLPVDVYAPCALGGVLNNDTIPELRAKIVAGAANNQLLDETHHSSMLVERGILFAPDYVINAGGLINVYQELIGYDRKAAHDKAANIYNTLLAIYEEAKSEGCTTLTAANRIAEKRIDSVQNMKDLRNSFNNQGWIEK